MTPLPDEPKVVIWVEDGKLLGIATNVSPDTNLTLTNCQQDFLTYSSGLPFANSVSDSPAKT